VGSKGIGYHTEIPGGETTEAGDPANLLRHVESGDLVQFGLIPEFVGRLPVVGILDELSVDDYVRILTEPKNAIVRQYRRLFEIEGCELEFTDGALQEIARRARERATGVRALRSIIEESMLDVVFDLPSRPPSRYRVTEEFLRRRSPIEVEPLPEKAGGRSPKSAPTVREVDVDPDSDQRREAG
jgi:ATP-dependent Clp protease ATP-binding subunit ClpX